MKTKAFLFAAGFLGCILAANYVTTRYGFVSVGLGETATAGTYFAGLAFVLRDSLQDAAGKRAVGATIAVGAVLSLVLALTVYRADAAFLPPGVTPVSIAVASGLAFLLSETADLLVYTPLRRRGYIRAAVASNVVGAIVDTFLFLWVAGFPVWANVSGQLIGKLTVTLAVVLLVGAARAVLRQPVRV
jgi:uncharacterized PurR-regulated membrane protein YhhQ (DUF165 family)